MNECNYQMNFDDTWIQIMACGVEQEATVIESRKVIYVSIIYEILKEKDIRFDKRSMFM